MKVYGDYPLDNIFVYPLKLSQLMSVVISIDAPIDVTAMMDCLGCVNARSLCFNASHISSCHLVPWHEYTHLKSLQICNTTLTPPRIRFSNDTIFPPSIKSLTLPSKTTLPLGVLYTRLAVENLQQLTVDLGTDPFFLPPLERSFASLRCLKVSTSSLPRDMSSVTSLEQFTWKIPGVCPKPSAFPERMPSGLQEISVHTPTWVRGLETCAIPNLEMVFTLDGDDLIFPQGTYLSHAKVLSLTVLRKRGTEHVNCNAFRFAVNVKVMKIDYDILEWFLITMENVPLPRLRKFYVFIDDDTELSFVQDILDDFEDRGFLQGVVVKMIERFCSDSSDDDSE